MKTTNDPFVSFALHRSIGSQWISPRIIALMMASAFVPGIAPGANSVPTAVPQPTAAQLETAGLAEFPLAPDAQRVDLRAAAFSNSTRIDNPIFPIRNLHSVVLNGQVDGKVFRVETTLLPETQIVEWVPGQCVKVLVSQYVAYINGRLDEVAIDLYAQADDGSVWYFGEDVYNYVDGVIEDTAGTWRAGKEGPAAMIMPGRPKVGDAHRPENIPGLVFEEVAVNKINETVAGPRGPVAGALVARELHDDGSFSDKIFAPGYGEFFTSRDGNVEALALAIPTDARTGPMPPDLEAIVDGAQGTFDHVQAKNWARASATVKEMNAAWQRHRGTGVVPIRLVEPMTRALAQLTATVTARQPKKTLQGALDVEQAALDLLLQFAPVVEINIDRFHLWLHQLIVDAQYRNADGLKGDAATLEWMRDRIAGALDRTDVTHIDVLLKDLRGLVNDGNFKASMAAAEELAQVLDDAADRAAL